MVLARVRGRIERHQHLFAPAFLLGGFLADVLTFRTLQVSTTFSLLGAYAAVAAAAIVVGDRGPGFFRKALPVALQFAFGALLSSSLLFYWYSGSFSASWPVMGLVVALMAGNEKFRHVLFRPTVQVGAYAFVLFSYATLLLPFLLRSISAWVFVLGGLASSAVAALLVLAVARFDVSRRPLRRRMLSTVAAVFVGFNALYFLRVIPPIPLSIRDAGIYHDVVALGGEYELVGEEEGFFAALWPGQTLHAADDDGRFYAYTSVFAPTALEARIVHRWQQYDPEANEWADRGTSSYAMRGGRDGGFRGYSYRTIRQPGRWRVIVETERGQELGRLRFNVEE